MELFLLLRKKRNKKYSFPIFWEKRILKGKNCLVQFWPASCRSILMNVRTILLAMAETLPPDATIHDAINRLEFAASVLENIPTPSKQPEPAWLYESSSRFLAVRNQSLRRENPSPGERQPFTFCEEPLSQK
jgi:hypothetical protein